MTINLPAKMTAKQKADFVSILIAPLAKKAMPHIKDLSFQPAGTLGIGDVVYTLDGDVQVVFAATIKNIETICKNVLISYRAHCHGDQNRLLRKTRKTAV